MYIFLFRYSSTFKPRATDILTQAAGDEDGDDDDEKEDDDDDASIIELSTTPNGRAKIRKLLIDAAEKRLLESIELSDREIKKRLDQVTR